MSTIPTPADRLTQATASRILALVDAFGTACEAYGRVDVDLSDGWIDRCRQARAEMDAALAAVDKAVYDAVDWQAVVDANLAARSAATPAQDGDR